MPQLERCVYCAVAMTTIKKLATRRGGHIRPQVALAISGLALIGLTGASAATFAATPEAADIDMNALAAQQFPTVPDAAHSVALETVAEAAEAAAPDVAPPPAPTPVAPALETSSGVVIGSGVASYYADRFHGRRTANGERFDMHAMTAAHRTLPFGSKVRVINPANGKSVVVRINDRGPFHGNRVIDLSKAAATQLGLVARGHGRVQIEKIG